MRPSLHAPLRVGHGVRQSARAARLCCHAPGRHSRPPVCLQVFRLTYPYQEQLRNWDGFSDAAASSIYSMPAPVFYKLHPFHLILDQHMQLLQWGSGVAQVVPDMAVGQHVRLHFRVSGPAARVEAVH